MEERHAIEGNTPPKSDPEPSVPAGSHGTENPLRPGGWPNVGDDGPFNVPGNPAPSSEPIP